MDQAEPFHRPSAAKVFITSISAALWSVVTSAEEAVPTSEVACAAPARWEMAVVP